MLWRRLSGTDGFLCSRHDLSNGGGDGLRSLVCRDRLRGLVRHDDNSLVDGGVTSPLVDFCDALAALSVDSNADCDECDGEQDPA